MKNTFGNNISLTIFGESHGSAIGCVLDGVPAGIKIDEERINKLLSLRRPSGSISTSRSEADEYSFQSGVFNGFTTGTPICILIPNKDTRSNDYSEMSCIARPSHADYTAHIKYRGFEDYRGGGHFSGRITAALVAAGGILIPALEKKNIYIGSHVKSIGKVSDRSFENVRADIEKLADMSFAVLDEEKQVEMTELILAAKNDGDSVGGIVETAVCGIEAGVGEPWFDTLEGLISHAVFSIPAVKGIEFGAGFAITEMRGSEANDSFFSESGMVYTETNNSGGINGGISNGADIIFRTAFKPTPTIAKEQNTINYVNNENSTLSAAGRHDPCIVHRARTVVDCVTALVVADVLTGKHGADWLAL